MHPIRKHGRWNEPRPKFGLARVLSKLGFCSRSQGQILIREGRVSVNGRLCRDPEWPVDLPRDKIQVDGQGIEAADKVYLALHKPRGLVTTREDEQGRGTVYQCLEGHGLPWLSPVGRLDKASEGLILFTNDTAWADHLLDPRSQVEKVYHVQVQLVADAGLCERIMRGIPSEGHELLTAKRVTVLRQGTHNSWLEVTLDEGKNRQIRRLCDALSVTVLRLVRVAIGPLALGSLATGQFRHLSRAEVVALGPKPSPELRPGPGQRTPVNSRPPWDKAG